VDVLLNEQLYLGRASCRKAGIEKKTERPHLKRETSWRMRNKVRGSQVKHARAMIELMRGDEIVAPNVIIIKKKRPAKAGLQTRGTHI